MQRHAWHSRHTGREMPVLRFGEAGAAMLYIPSSGGDETELQGYGMDRECASWIEARRLQVFTIDGFGPHGLFNDEIGPAERVRRHAAFERYVVEELLPWIESVSPGQGLGVVGSSYGALVASNLLFRHPQRIRVACGLGGVYGLWHRLDGFHDDDVYFHTPLEYLPRLDDPEIISAIRRTRGLAMFGAAQDPWLPSTRSMAHILRGRGLPYTVEIWPAPADHHEKWWRLQLRRFLENHL